MFFFLQFNYIFTKHSAFATVRIYRLHGVLTSQPLIILPVKLVPSRKSGNSQRLCEPFVQFDNLKRVLGGTPGPTRVLSVVNRRTYRINIIGVDPALFALSVRCSDAHWRSRCRCLSNGRNTKVRVLPCLNRRWQHTSRYV